MLGRGKTGNKIPKEKKGRGKNTSEDWLEKVATASNIPLEEFQRMNSDMFNEETLDSAPRPKD